MRNAMHADHARFAPASRALFTAMALTALGTSHSAHGEELTPVGAQAEGNAAGSIPPWTGGMRAPPAGWRREQGYVDPFAGESPIVVLDKNNMSGYANALSDGEKALLERNAHFRMPVYPTHRTAAYPPEVVATPVDAHSQGGGVPFKVPKNGLEAISNHLLRWVGGGVERDFDAFVVPTRGEATRIGFHDKRIYDTNLDVPQPGEMYVYLGYFLRPADLVGTMYLVHEPNPLGDGKREAWIYNDGQRRVRRAPDLAYDSVQNGSEGLAIVDQYDGYNGSPDHYDWTLLGKRELLVPYNDYKIGDKHLEYRDIVQPGSPNPDYLRFEMHRVWVVEAKLKPGLQHVYARRVFYLDEDSWSVLVSEAYDSHGQLWRVGLHSLIEYYDAQVPWYRFEYWYDLTNGSYVLTGLDNAEKKPWSFGGKGRSIEFEPDALRRAGH